MTRLTGIKRIVFASSNHVMGYYRAQDTIAIFASAASGQPLWSQQGVWRGAGPHVRDKYGIEVACLRIGSFRARPEDARQLATWISHRDMVERRAAAWRPGISLSGLYSAIEQHPFAGRRIRMPLAWAINPAIMRNNTQRIFNEDAAAGGQPRGHFQGGPFCALEFTGDASLIE